MHNENVVKWAREEGESCLCSRLGKGGDRSIGLGRRVPGEESPRSDDWATMGRKKVSAVEPTTSAERTDPETK